MTILIDSGNQRTGKWSISFYTGSTPSSFAISADSGLVQRLDNEARSKTRNVLDRLYFFHQYILHLSVEICGRIVGHCRIQVSNTD
jgi:hypothetical protein